MGVIGWIIFGLIVGIVAKFLMPGLIPAGLWSPPSSGSSGPYLADTSAAPWDGIGKGSQRVSLWP